MGSGVTNEPPHQVSLYVTGAPVRHVEAWRRRYDPVRAAAIPAHVTLLLDDELPPFDVLLQRLRTAASSVPPAILGLGAVRHWPPDPDAGVYADVDDRYGTLTRLRAALLGAPQAEHSFHVTVAHPATGRCADAWRALADTRIDGTVTVDRLRIIAIRDEPRLTVDVVTTVALSGSA